jgi:hypothetical protein
MSRLDASSRSSGAETRLAVASQPRARLPCTFLPCSGNLPRNSPIFLFKPPSSFNLQPSISFPQTHNTPPSYTHPQRRLSSNHPLLSAPECQNGFKMNTSSSSRLWGPESDILSMETRILPGRTPPTSSRPEVQIPARRQDHSSTTPPTSTTRIIPTAKRPESASSHSAFEMNPTPSKRQRLDHDDIMPKMEADQIPILASPGNGNSVESASEITVEPAKTQPVKYSYAR